MALPYQSTEPRRLVPGRLIALKLSLVWQQRHPVGKGHPVAQARTRDPQRTAIWLAEDPGRLIAAGMVLMARSVIEDMVGSPCTASAVPLELRFRLKDTDS